MGQVFVLFGNSQVWVFDNAKCKKNCSGPVLLFLGNLKSCLGPGLRKPKRGDYEVMGGGYGM